jgi:hypothetical protein
VLGHKLYKDYNIRAMTKSQGMPATIFLGIQTSPSTKTLIFCQREKKKLA